MDTQYLSNNPNVVQLNAMSIESHVFSPFLVPLVASHRVLDCGGNPAEEALTMQ